MSAPEIFHSYILPLEVVIRGTHEEDLEELEWCGLFTHHRELIREAYERQERGEVVMLVAEVNNSPVAQVWVDLRRRAVASAGFIWAVRVNPLFRSQGIGGKMLTEAEEVIRSNGLEAAELGVEKDNPGARSLYERAGYRVLNSAYEEYEYTDETGERALVAVDQWIMRKPLVQENRRAG